MSLDKVFTDIHARNAWGSGESVSGSGSELRATQTLRERLPRLLAEFGIQSMLDLPCGDLNWIRHVELGVEYTGADIVPALIERNRQRFPDHRFLVLDASRDQLPRVDLVLMRDMLGHLSIPNALRVIENVRASGARYLLATSFTRYAVNPPNPVDGGWYCINLMLAPFGLRPIALINEDCTEGDGYSYNDKSLLLVDMTKPRAGYP